MQAATGAGGVEPAAIGPGGFAMPLRVLLGLSLIANMALAAAVMRRRKKLTV